LVGFPIPPIIPRETADDPARRDCVREHYHIRHCSLFVPWDFDVSPSFQIIKPDLLQGAYHSLRWSNDKTDASVGVKPLLKTEHPGHTGTAP